MSRQRYSVRLADESTIEFTLDVGKRRRLTMTFVEGELTVRVPYGCSNKRINDFIVSNSDWIKKNSAMLNDRIGLPKSYEQGEKIRLLGKVYELCFKLSDNYFKPYLCEDKFMIAVRPDSTQSYKQAQIDEFIRCLAKDTVMDCMQKMSEKVGLRPERLTLKSMTSRWGSCSSKGSISINFKVIQFPIECIEYVCIHELCHIEHMDHSKEFWAKVESFCPNWKQLRDEMKN